MKVALLTESIRTGSPGFQSYASGLIEGLNALADGNEYVPVRRQTAAPDGATRGLATRIGESSLFRQIQLPPYLATCGFDVVHDTYHFGPFLRPSPYARILTIGDLTPLVTKTHAARRRWAHRLLVPVIAHRAHAIATFSENSRRDIVRLLHLPVDRVTVTYLAASERFRCLSAEEIEAARSRLELPSRYFLHVGTLEPRKNIAMLVRAFAAALLELGDAALVLVGQPGWRMESLPALLRELGVERRVLVRSDISGDDLPAVYCGAIALAYPSLYEGFGLPPLEAMQCGVPVIASNVSSLPEVVGDAALSVDPHSLDELAQAISCVANDPDLRASLRERGLRRAGDFSWRRCAELTRSVYERAATASRTAAGERLRAGA